MAMEDRLKWKDITNRMRNEPPDSEPRTYEAQAGVLRLVVTRHIDIGESQWRVTCEALGIKEDTDYMCSLKNAKQMLCSFVFEKMRDICEELGCGGDMVP